MKKKVLAVIMSMVCILGCLAGCGAAEKEKTDVSVGSLKGPTSMGLVYLMSQSQKGEAAENYTFTMETAADELLVQVVSGDMDIALVPANVASILYHKTEGGISVIDINTLGVLYMVSGDSSLQSMETLKGRTIYLTGKGTTPDYVLQYLLTENGLTLGDVTLEYKSEAAEVVAVLTENSDAVGVLPQPFATVACMQNEALSVVMDLTKEWSAIQGEGGSSLVTGVTIVRNDFLQENPQAVASFMEEHEKSAAFANENVQEAAELTASYGIIEKAPVAAKAMPYCNITYMDGEDMKTALSGYLEVLFEQDASSIGGSLPADDFYYIP
ncbi:MAG: ABC transporter substrate-binding protein [Roseburia sp.]|nr:ABC transporter substrate-binding protein [Roseburia sp.]MCM1244005.1 ABC transporter substrate-binding protein [Roseburia sp.]